MQDWRRTWTSTPAKARAGSPLSAGLVAATQEASRFKTAQPRQELQGWQAQRADLIIASNQHCNRYRKGTQILLKLEVLICGDEEVKARRGQPQQLTVLYAGPPRLDHSNNLVADENLTQSARK